MKARQQNLQVQRYFNNYRNEATKDDESILEGMLGIMARASLKYFPLADVDAHFYCRAVAWVKTSTNQNHLIIASSMHCNGKTYHAEEALATAIYNQYKNDPNIVKQDNVIQIHKMYIDIEPCDGARYANHHCQQFFDDIGRNITHNDAQQRVRFQSDTAIYWNAPLSAKNSSTSVRSQEQERDAMILGVDFSQTFQRIDHWDNCFVVTDLKNPVEVDLSRLFAAELEEAKPSSDISFVKSLLNTIQNKAAYHKFFTQTTLQFIGSLVKAKDQMQLHYVARAIARDSSLRLLLSIPNISIQEARAIKEIQDWYKNPLMVEEQQEAMQNNNNNNNNNIAAFNDPNNNNNIPMDDTPIEVMELEINKLMAVQANSTWDLEDGEIRAPITQQSNEVEVEIKLKNKENNSEKKNSKMEKDAYKKKESKMEKDEYKKKDSKMEKDEYKRKDSKKEKDDYEKKDTKKKEDDSKKIDFKDSIPRLVYTLHKKMNQRSSKGFSKEAISYLDEIKNHRDFDDIILETNNGGFNLLHHLLKNCHPQILNYFFKMLRTEKMDRKTIEHVLLDTYKSHKLGITPLQVILGNGDPQNLLIYLVELQKAVEDKIISKRQFGELLTKSDRLGFTPVHEVLKSGDVEKTAIYFKALKAAWKKGLIDKDDYKKVLVGQNKNGYTPLHEVFIAGEIENVVLYFQALQDALAMGIIERDDYKSVLILANNAGFTPLHDAFISRHTEIVALYFKMLQTSVKDRSLPIEDYQELLTSETERGFSPLHSALKVGQVENVTLYFKALEFAFTLDEYKKLLINKNKSGFNPLHSALQKGNADNTALYFQKLKTALANGSILAPEYQEVLVERTEAGFTPLHYALEAGQSESALTYFTELREALEAGIVEGDRYKKVLIEPNEDGFTPLLCALKAGNEANLQLYFKELQYALERGVITSAEYIDVLIKANVSGYTPVQSALESGNEANVALYFKVLQDAYETQKILTPEDLEKYRTVLISKNSEGFSPLHQVLVARNVENLKLYFVTLQSAFKAKILSAYDIKELLIGRNKKGFNPLHSALAKKQPENLALFLSLLDKFVTEKNEYKHVLIDKNEAGYSPLHEAFEFGDTESVAMYFKALQSARITNEEYKALLIDKTKSGFTPLALLLKAGNSDNANLYFNKLNTAFKEQIITEEEYLIALTASNNKQWTPLHQVVKSDNVELADHYVDELYQRFPTKAHTLITKMLATKTDGGGYTPSCTKGADAPAMSKFLKSLRKERKLKQNPHHSDHSSKRKRDDDIHGQDIPHSRGMEQEKSNITYSPKLFSSNEIDSNKKPKTGSVAKNDNCNNNNNQHEVREAPNVQFMHDSHLFKQKSDNSNTLAKQQETNQLIPVEESFNTAEDTFNVRLGNQEHTMRKSYCQKEDPNFTTYGCVNNEKKKTYFINLKKHKESGNYNFEKFKNFEENPNVILVINFACPEGATLVLPELPLHLKCFFKCYIHPQPASVSIKGDYEVLGENKDSQPDAMMCS